MAVGVAYDVLASGPHTVLDTIAQARPDVAVVDFMMPAWLCEAAASGVPAVALVHTLYDRMAAGLLTAFTTLDAINACAPSWGWQRLPTRRQALDGLARVLVTAPRELDGAPAVPANTRFVGAILEEPGPDAGWTPPAVDTPIVAVSMGTTKGLGDEPVIGRVLDAIAGRPVYTLVNAGAHVDGSALHPPANARVEGYVRHAVVMPHADVVVTHAGLGTICAALSFGVPLVCIPLGRDQPHNAERVETVGAGIALPPDADLGADQRSDRAGARRAELRRVSPPLRRRVRPDGAHCNRRARVTLDRLNSSGCRDCQIKR